MKKLVIILFLTLGIGNLKSYAQVPGITYQAVILSPDGKALPGINHANTPLAEQEICLKFSFLNLAGDYEYEEIIQTKTDPFGMVNVIIGKGEQVGGLAASFDKIPWSIAAKFLEVSLDKSGACGEFSLISKQEFTAVPFALFSVNSGATDSESTQGKSAYQFWIDLGNVGSEQDFINSLKGPIGATGPAGTIGPAGVSGAAGPQGPTGSTGITGTTGPAGTTGSNGLSAYQIWLGLGNTGTENNFIASLTGPTGQQGPAGVAGATGTTGNRGATGVAGSNGLSAYQVWLGLGNTGTENNFIASLTGPAGPRGPAGATGPAGADGAAASAATFVDLSTNQTIGGTKTFTNPIAGSITGSAGSTSGNAATATLAAEATKLATPRAINGVAFDGSAPITVTAAAETVTGSTLNATVTGSSLTSVGTLTNLTVTNPIAGSVTGNATTVTTNANLSGDVTSLGNVTTLSNSAVIGQVLTGYAAGAGTVAATDNILQAIQKVDGNINAAISSVASGKQNTLTNSAGLLGALNDETGTGLAVFSSSPTLATPDLGTPSAVVLTNATGLPLPSGVSGTLTVANGGTGATSLTGYMKGNGTSTMTASASIPVADVTGAATQTALNLKANIASPTFTGSLNVDGAASNFQTKVYSTSDTTLDFALSNLITTNASAGAFNLENMKDGGTYTLAVTGGVSGTASFSQSGLSLSSLHNVSTTSGKTALYTFIVMGTQVYFSMTSVE
uniref:beta strand repeat-containing protein n=1 Tax=Algoriphagus sp. TaxID=1872435 RepID=UPI004047E478